MKVFLLISSDETYKYILSSKELANGVKKRFRDEGFSGPEEITVDDCPVRPDGELYHVTMTESGIVEDVYIEELIIDYKDHYNVNGIGFDINNDFFTWVWAKTRHEAISMVDSMRKKLIKTGKWPKKSRKF